MRVVIGAGDAGAIAIRIADTGPGPGDGGIGHRGHPDGHGLGLLVCRDIVRSLGGTLDLAAGEGGGAELCIVVPGTGAAA